MIYVMLQIVRGGGPIYFAHAETLVEVSYVIPVITGALVR